MKRVKQWKIWSDESDDAVLSNESDVDRAKITYVGLGKKSSKKKKKHKKKQVSEKSEKIAKKTSDSYSSKNTSFQTTDLSEEENELISKEPISINKKSFVFNINLDNSNCDTSNQDISSPNKKEVKEMNIDSNLAIKKSNEKDQILTSKNFILNTKSLSNIGNIPKTIQYDLNCRNNHPSFLSNSNMNYSVASNFLNEKDMSDFHNSYLTIDMDYTSTSPFKPYELPPLPTDSEPEKPPEPTFDSKRLSNQKIINMFISQDITRDSLKSFFEDKKMNNIPSPASSIENDINDDAKRNNSKSDNTTRDHDSVLQDSYSSSSNSETHSYSTGKRRHSSWSSARSHSYFTSTSSNESDHSYTSSDTDISRPCRHYRPGKKRYSSSHSRSRSNSLSSHSSYFSD